MIIKRNPAPKAYLALLGDKDLLVSETGTTFLMYGTSGNSWIALGDPVGPSETAADLIKRFVSVSRMQGARPVFHEVGLDHLTVYADLGLSSVHIADMARVRLASFGLEGSANRSLRNHIRGAGRYCSFELFSRPVRDNILAELRAVSDEWLATRKTREKRFSMGCFDPQYLRRFQIGAVRQGKSLVAFATIWSGRDELFIDLMRLRPTAPRGSMDFLIVSLIQWAQSVGYQWLNLGMAPLPDDRPPLLLQGPSGWMISLIRRLGERFYHFSSLREFKDKFNPEWRPRYFVSPPGYGSLRALADLAVLTSGGWRGVVSR
jgi:phosphatidylglycerol lysyltransferase